ncbi:MAG: TIGR03986 family CRISPR-associated RAMP protein [Candidatus Brocadiaceae bacterium]|nr:TIGR03986 family CRISPR-associated RAMP protein [Candidatus Brocadiaceae bacterium]
MPEKIPITLTFFEPYRLIEWYAKESRKADAKYLRGQSFAQWHKKADGSVERPYITGTLLRSAVIRAAEELICLGNDGYGKCCTGEFKTAGGTKPFFLRKRPTLVNTRPERPVVCQSKEDACALCLLLGRFDKAGKNHSVHRHTQNDYDIHFGNLDLISKSTFAHIKDMASKRGLNRVNHHTGKARDYFKVWEVDDEDYWTFQGVITVQDDVITGNEQGKKAVQLLRDSLSFVDKLCGAICRITTENKDAGASRQLLITPKETATASVSKEQSLNPIPPKNGSGEVKSGLSEETKISLKKCAQAIVDDFKRVDKLEKARTLADVVRAMRLEKPDIIEKLPRGREGKGHHLWDIKVGDKSLRDVLKELKPSDNNHWRAFCEILGNEIYFKYKEKTGGYNPQMGILGEVVEYHAKPGSSDTCITLASGNTGTSEWIVAGSLKAITPFFFGTESGEGDQTSYRILLNKKNQYRMPRSLMRGVLRRDLRTVFDSGCNAEPGGMRPCNCPVCIIMRRITIMDSRSDYKEPPDIRYRIRMNPQTATVDEGALFDMEVGPEGITFPFVLRYRGEGEFPAELWSVIRYWKDGMAWLGGSNSTGKGRFSLEDIKIYQWDLNGGGLSSYISEKGLRGNELDIKDDKLPSGLNTTVGLPDNSKIYEPYQKYLKPQWQEVTYTMEIASPLLSADTIAALLDPDNRDSIAYEKRVWNEHEKKTGLVPTIKGETIRGIVRTAVGKQNGLLNEEHKECDCELCMIFGNEHEAGKIRFEDLEVKTAQNCKKIDHVAIDRFTGGAVDKKKFDTYPIAGSPNNPIHLQGTFWMKRDLTNKEKEYIGDALLDMKQGLYPIGGKTGIGYGWVSDLAVPSTFGYFKDLAKEKEETDVQKDILEVCPPYNKERPPPELPDGKNGERFYPHYFLKPDKSVNREPVLPALGHEKFNNGLLTGKIACSLKTLTPLIIPDSVYHYDFCGWEFAPHLTVKGLCDAISGSISGISLQAIPGTIHWLNNLLKVPNLYDMIQKSDSNFSQDIMKLVDNTKAYRNKDFSILNEEEKGAIKILNRLILEELYPEKTPKSNKHKRYRFFRINDEVMMPGSEIRGTISTIYETITNSCFRVFEDSKYLSRRISTDQKPKYGMVTNGATSITEIEEVYRIPLYDDEKVTNAIVFKDHANYKNGNDLRKRRIQTAFEWNKVIACIAEENRTFLLNMRSEKREKVLHGEVSITFNLIEGVNPKDCIAILGKIQGTELSQFEITVKNEKEREGFIKFTGMNMVNIKKPVEQKSDFQDSWDVELLNVLHNNKDTWRKSLKQSYPRPVLLFVKDKVQYTIPKRCERIFSAPLDTVTKYEVPTKVRDQYGSILEDYKKNFGHIDEKFLTKVQHQELTDGDLVYFFANKDKDKVVKAVMPVPLSRMTDDKPMGEKLPDKNLLPCDHDYSEYGSASSHLERLCPACRLLGTTNYKGRVRFGFARLKEGSIPKRNKDGIGGDGDYITLPLLACPRPTWSIPSDTFKVPGRKFYVHHNGWDKEEKNRNENNRSVERLGKDSEFTFDVFFENLEKWELGLFLYSLELEPENNLAHKIGMAKAHGFGSVQIMINEILFRSNPDTWVSGNRCKNQLLDAGYAKLREWYGKGQEWYNITHIQKLRKLLKYENENERKVEYPKLEGEGGLPGYDELGDGKKWPYKKRVECLTTPWYPYYTPKDDKQESKSEIKDTITPGNSIVHKGDQRKPTPKSKIPLSNKYSGIIKSFEKNGEIVVAKENGGDVQGRYYEKTLIKVGQKIKFRVEQGAMFTKIYDVEIVK